MILSAQSIELRMKDTLERRHFQNWRLGIEPFFPWAQRAHGLTYGLTSAGYDIRVGSLGEQLTDSEAIRMPPGTFMLASSLERIRMPYDLQAIVHDKSSWARQGLALQNTVLEPGWEGHITLELSNHGPNDLYIFTGQPIAQLIFHMLDQPTNRPYKGKYQNQGPEPVEAIYEHDTVESLMQDLNDGNNEQAEESSSSPPRFHTDSEES